MGFSTVETLLDEASQNMAAGNMSRNSRGSMGQKAGSAMRVVKPSSTNNSPRNSATLGRRMTDGAYRRRLAMLEQGTRDVVPFVTNHGLQQPSLPSNRPVSWHPNSQAPQSYQVYQQPIQADNLYQMFNYQPSPIVYSSYNSPSSSFSPELGYIYGYEQQQQQQQQPQILQNRHSYHTSNYAPQQPTLLSQPIQQQSQDADPSMYSHFDWNTFAAQGFEDASTTPPTPENFLPIQHPEPSFQEDAIPYQPLDDADEGEELIGLGLYDAPEAKSPQSDPQLDNYRALMMAQMMGTPYRRPEPTGKGLKLEETWAPPASEDGDDSDQDGEGDDEQEVTAPQVDASSFQGNNSILPSNAGYFVPSQQDMHAFNTTGWL